MTGAELLAQRIMARVEYDGDCWIWTGAKTHNGYGRMSANGARVYVHRLAYELLVGPIPDGLYIDHLCRVRRCVNPAHMEPVTFAENCLRGEGLPAKNARKTHCPKGHPYSPENTSRDKKGHRECIACRRERNRAKYHADPELRVKTIARSVRNKQRRRAEA